MPLIKKAIAGFLRWALDDWERQMSTLTNAVADEKSARIALTQVVTTMMSTVDESAARIIDLTEQLKNMNPGEGEEAAAALVEEAEAMRTLAKTVVSHLAVITDPPAGETAAQGAAEHAGFQQQDKPVDRDPNLPVT